MTGNVTPDTAKPAPLTVAELIVTGAVPVEVNVNGCVDIVFTVTLPKVRLAALAVNWFGDSLDGTLARVRNRLRPRYGFYVDHITDAIGTFFLMGGLALCSYMSPYIALGLLIAYLLLSIEVYLTTYVLGAFHMSFWSFGPTELRLLLCIGNLALFWRPIVSIAGHRFLLFDVGGAIGICGMAMMLVWSAVRHTFQLYRAERLP